MVVLSIRYFLVPIPRNLHHAAYRTEMTGNSLVYGGTTASSPPLKIPAPTGPNHPKRVGFAATAFLQGERPDEAR